MLTYFFFFFCLPIFLQFLRPADTVRPGIESTPLLCNPWLIHKYLCHQKHCVRRSFINALSINSLIYSVGMYICLFYYFFYWEHFFQNFFPYKFFLVATSVGILSGQGLISQCRFLPQSQHWKREIHETGSHGRNPWDLSGWYQLTLINSSYLVSVRTP